MNGEQLESAAIRAHTGGMAWADFWPAVAADVAAIHPWDNRVYNRLVTRLLLLLVAGDLDGERPPRDWFDDDDMPGREVQDESAACVVPIDTGWERPAAWELEAIEAAR